MGDQDISALISLAIDDKVSPVLKDIEQTLTKVTDKLGDLDKLDFSHLQRSLSDMSKDLSNFAGLTQQATSQLASAKIAESKSRTGVNNARANRISVGEQLDIQKAQLNAAKIQNDISAKNANTQSQIEQRKREVDIKELEAISKDKARNDQLEVEKQKLYAREVEVVLKQQERAARLAQYIKESNEKITRDTKSSYYKNARESAAARNQINQGNLARARQDVINNESHFRVFQISENTALAKARRESIAFRDSLRAKQDKERGAYITPFLERRKRIFENTNEGKRGFFGSAIRGFGQARSGMYGAVSSFAERGLAGSLTKATGFGAALGIATERLIEFGGAALDAYGRMEKLSTSLEVVYGSKTESDATFTELQQYAVKSPFGMEQTTEMAILLKQSGVYASELLDVMKMIGDVSGGNNEKMKRIANNYAQIQAIGHANMLDMRQFAYAGIPIYKEVADYLSVTQDKLRSMISNGEVTAEVIENVFKRMTGKGGIFENATQKGARTLSARRLNLQDTTEIAMSEWGKLMWNTGSEAGEASSPSKFMSLIESVVNKFGSVATFFNDIQGEEMAANADALLTPLETAYKNALKDNNQDLAEKLSVAISKLGNLTMGDEQIVAARAKYAERLITDGRERVSDKDMASLKELKGLYENELEWAKRTNDKDAASAWEKLLKDLDKEIAGSIDDSEFFKRLYEMSEWMRLTEGKETLSGAYRFREYQVVPDERYSEIKGERDRNFQIANSFSGLYDLILEYEKNVGLTRVNVNALGTGDSRGKMAQNMKPDIVSGIRAIGSDRANELADIFEREGLTDEVKNGLKELEKEVRAAFYSNADVISLSMARENIPDFYIPVDYDFSGQPKTESQMQNTKNQLAEMQKLNKTYLASTTDKLNKIADNANSLYSKAASNNEKWEQSTKEGKLAQEEREKAREEQLRKDRERAASAFDFGLNRFKTDNVENVLFALNNGFARFEELNLSKSAIRNDDSILKDFSSSVETVRELLSDIADDNLKDIISQLSDEAKTAAEQNELTDTLVRLLTDIQVAELKLDGEGSEQVKQVLSLLGKRVSGTAGEIKNTFDEDTKKKGKELPDFVPLWKRIIAADTGWDTGAITSSKDFMAQYEKQIQRETSKGMITGLVSAGFGAKDIGNMLSYQNATAQDGVRQIDWAKTERDMIKYAMSMKGGTKQTAAALTGLSDSLQSTLSVFNKLTVDMHTVGEDWTTINNDLKGAFSTKQGLSYKNYFDNAFSLVAPESKKYSLETTDQGIMVKNLSTGKLEGSLDELKESTDKNSAELNTWLSKIKWDDIIGALDSARDKIQTLTDTVNIANSIAQQTLNFEKNSRSARGEAFGSSSGVVSTVVGLAGSQKISVEAERQLSSFLGSLFAQISELGAKGELSRADAENVYRKIAGLSDDEEIKSPRANQDIEYIQKNAAKLNTDDYSQAVHDFEMLLYQFPKNIIKALVESAEGYASTTTDMASMNSATSLMPRFRAPLRQEDSGFAGLFLKKDNSIAQQNLMNKLGMGDQSWKSVSQDITSQVLASSSSKKDYAPLADRYKEAFEKNYTGDNKEQILASFGEDAADYEYLKETYDSEMGEGAFDKLTEGINRASLATQDLQAQFVTLGQNIGNALESFAGSAISSTMSTWGKALAEGADSSEALMENFRQLGAGLMSNLGMMITEAGLSMAIHAPDIAHVYAGLAIAAAGGGLSFLGGMLSADKEEDDDDDDDYQRLLAIKEDLSDLLKQAREDAIYYEKTVRHQNALSTNGSLGTTTKVNDAIITPSGDVISTHPDDYLIATKTPQTLVGGGGGAPTVNFSVIDKSTGIKVTQQKSNYNADTNSIDFEAVIESKISEFIATEKGDNAFDTRAARIRGRSYIG